MTTLPVYKKKDFMSDQTVRWCPGCGDYSILAQTQAVMAELGIPRENFTVVSGIGCSSRFPYYLNTYGMHTIHGRAPAFATGIRLANPELSVWIATGDGDSLSIGGNHLIHVLRRNVDVQILQFNNRIYGLTKGQYSPTSKPGSKTKSTPMGSVDHAFEPCALALGADASFVARTSDVFVKELRGVLKDAAEHKGASFIEIWQNCVIFNDKVFADHTDKSIRGQRCLFVEHGKPMVFGSEEEPWGLRLNGLALEAAPLSDDFTLDQVMVHDETNAVLASILSRMEAPLPAAMGVLYRKPRPVYERSVHDQIALARKKQGPADLKKAFEAGSLWVVK